MKKLSSLDMLALVLVIIGAINWGLVGFFKFDLVAAIFGSMTVIDRIIYAVVGLAGIYIAATSLKLAKK